MDSGLGPRRTLLLLLGWSTLCALAGLLLEAAPPYLSLLCYFLLFCGHCLFAQNPGSIVARLQFNAK